MNTKTTVISEEQLASQYAYCDKISAYWLSQHRTPTAYVETYGCQQNEADSEKLRGYLVQSGYAIVNDAEGDGRHKTDNFFYTGCNIKRCEGLCVV